MGKHRRGSRPAHLAVMALPVAALTVGPALAYPFDKPGDGLDPAVLESFQRLTKQMDRLDWDDEHPFIERAINSIWQRNGWNDEADRFARDLACELTAIPPWEPLKRLNLFNERVAKRYNLSKEEAIRFQSAMMREAGGLLMRNAGVILEQTREGMEARLRGEPFTAEQVARWSKQSQPLIVELRKSVDRLTDELKPMLKPRERRILERDLKSLKNKRRRYMDKMIDRWADGKWQPADWGLQDDPIQGTAPASDRAKPARPAGKPPAEPQQQARTKIPHWVAHEPATWFAYLLDFQKRFNLDPGQMSTAESIHAELLDRARRYAETHADSLKAVPTRERTTHEAYEPIRLLFSELQSRLDVIPTTSQRDRGRQ